MLTLPLDLQNLDYHKQKICTICSENKTIPSKKNVDYKCIIFPLYNQIKTGGIYYTIKYLKFITKKFLLKFISIEKNSPSKHSKIYINKFYMDSKFLNLQANDIKFFKDPSRLRIVVTIIYIYPINCQKI
ncbi:hypothetical protein BpHYR1_018527 [Brachionus plicatilis]|uniref:Uncharacterized protein n=1 Tax=Brachionus plicatilis TaxID=10195 RepID=A0A3M7RTC0_BRAPC|nr:hypothetical protein BpHYR1_018527 [Brachionus plicatilis]